VAGSADKSKKTVPVVVTMRVNCGCGHTEDETYEFDLPMAAAKPMEDHAPGTCPECRAPIWIHLSRTSARQ
jgi:hypothetical protein